MSAFSFYRFGVTLGLRSLAGGNVDLGLRTLANPVRSGFIRYIEMPYVIRALEPAPADRILDVGSPKHLALFLGARYGSRVTAIDLLDDFVDPYRAYARHLGVTGVAWEVQDGRALPAADASFDKTYSVSVLEHIPGEGDTLTIREMTRVLRPGGTCVLTLPFASEARHVTKAEDVYDRKYSGAPVFFCRYYSEETLRERLLEPSGLLETDRVSYRTRWGVERLWDRIPRRPRMALQAAGPLWAALSHRRIAAEEAEAGPWEGFCCLTLRKPG